MERIQITYQVTVAEYEAALKKASPDLLSVTQWAKYQAFPSDILIHLRTIAEKINSFPKEKTLYVRDFFSKQEWSSFPMGIKTSLGRMFYIQVVVERTVPNVEYLRQDSSDVAVYRKT